MLKKTLIIIFGLMVILFFIAYFLNFLAPIGLCRPGMKSIQDAIGQKSCYTPSGHEGQTCGKKTDCGSGECILWSDSWKCKDTTTLGCHSYLDENGQESAVCKD